MKNITLKQVATLITSVSVIATTVYAVENRFATKSELHAKSSTMARDIIELFIEQANDELNVLNYKIESGKADDIDKFRARALRDRIEKMKRKE